MYYATFMKKKRILVTGAAGFIGFHLIKQLIYNYHEIVGLDNINDYYSQKLKFDRLSELGIDKNNAKEFNIFVKSNKYKNFRFIRTNIECKHNLDKIFSERKFDIVCNLAAQAGVRYSLDNPNSYIKANTVGFFNIIDCCKQNKIDKLIYASSSSVYGNQNSIPFNENDKIDKPLSIYAATKITNELIAYTYSNLYKINTIGLRFFTVYGPWGRPDMAYFSFTESIIKGREIKIYNKGNLERDFTYIDDIICGLIKIVENNIENENNHEIYNIGYGNPINLLEFVKSLEKELKKGAVKKFVGMQPGDVNKTYADTKKLELDFNFKPKVSFRQGIKKFVKWYKDYYDEK